jgi:orotidine-5'-phosphate decarboxylase
MKELMWTGKGLMPAYDSKDLLSIEHLCGAIESGDPIKEIKTIKIGIIPSMQNGLPSIVKLIRKHGLDISLTLDLQKLGNDVEDVLQKIVETAHSNVQAIIVFPFAGPAAERAVIAQCRKMDIEVIIGGELTIPQFLKSQGGYIADDAPERILNLAIDEFGVNHFVVPGNKPERVKVYRALFDEKIGAGKYTMISPGFKFQGGKINEINEIAGPNWIAVIGRAIFKQSTELSMRLAMLNLVKELNG